MLELILRCSYVLLVPASPGEVARALAPLESRRRSILSPLPAISVQMVPSVGGTNAHVRLRLTRFWRLLTELSFLAWAATSVHAYLIPWLPADVLLENYPIWLYMYADVLPRCLLALMIASGTILIAGVQYARHRVAEALLLA